MIGRIFPEMEVSRLAVDTLSKRLEQNISEKIFPFLMCIIKCGMQL